MRLWLLILVTLLGACDARRDTARLLLDDLVAGGAASPLKAASAPVTRRTIAGLGDIYECAGSGSGARLLMLAPWGGALPDWAAVAMAESFARGGFATLIPAIPTEVLPPADAAERIGTVIATFAETPTGQGARPSARGPVAVIALSLAGAPALQALRAGPERVSGLALIAVPFDTRGHFAQWRRGDGTRPPDPRRAWTAFGAIAQRLAAPRDRRLLADIAERAAQGPGASIEDLTQALSPSGQALLDPMIRDDAPEPPGFAALFAATTIGQGDAPRPVLVITGRDDPLASPADGARTAQALSLPPDAAFDVDVLAGFGRGAEPSRSDRRLWLAALTRLIAWGDRP